MVWKKICSSLQFKIILFYLCISIYSIPIGFTQENPSKESAKEQKKILDLFSKVDTLTNLVSQLNTSNGDLKVEIERLNHAIREKERNINILKQELYNAKTDFNSYTDFGNPIGITSILVGVMCLVLTTIAVMSGIGFYKFHDAFNRQKQKLTEDAKSDIQNQTKLIIKKFLEEEIAPLLKNKIKKLDITFWALTAIARRLETQYWMQLTRSKMELSLALDKNNKFKMAIAKILSGEDVEDGLGSFYYIDKKTLPITFEKDIYLLYKKGLFIDHENDFGSFVNLKFHMDFEPWKTKMRKQLQKEKNSRLDEENDLL